MEVFAVDGDNEFEEEGGEVVENDLVLFGRGWWRSLNLGHGVGWCLSRGWRRSLRCCIHNSRSGSRSRRVWGFGTVLHGACASGSGNGVWIFGVGIRLLGMEVVYLSSTASSVLAT